MDEATSPRTRLRVTGAFVNDMLGARKLSFRRAPSMLLKN